MRKLISLFFVLVMAASCAADQHTLLGRDWSRMSADQKTLVLEGFTVGLFSSQIILESELIEASIANFGVPGDFAGERTRMGKATLLYLSRIENAASMVKIIDAWASRSPSRALAEDLPQLIISQSSAVLKAGLTRGPSTGYDDITRAFLDLLRGP